MKRKTGRRTVLLVLVGAIAVLLGVVLVPRHYAVPKIAARAGINYWQLSTGSRIAYTMLPGKGAVKPYPIIFLQGGPGGYITQRSVDLFGHLTDEGYTVYLYDQVGSGHSQRLDDIRGYTAERHVRDLTAIVQQTGAQKVILIGQSWGAILGTLFTADHPALVDRLILTGPGPIIPVRQELTSITPPDSLHLKPPAATNRQANEQVNNIRSRTVALWAQWFGKKLATDAEMDDFQTLLNQQLAKATVADTAHTPKVEGGGGYYVQLMTVASFASTPDPRPKLKDCPVPLFIMRGQYDNQPWGYATEYLSLFPHHQLVVIPDAGHSISVEQEETYLETLRGFLK